MRKRKTPHFFVKSIDPTPPKNPLVRGRSVAGLRLAKGGKKTLN
jgi:hypothetical protein